MKGESNKRLMEYKRDNVTDAWVPIYVSMSLYHCIQPTDANWLKLRNYLVGRQGTAVVVCFVIAWGVLGTKFR